MEERKKPEGGHGSYVVGTRLVPVFKGCLRLVFPCRKNSNDRLDYFYFYEGISVCSSGVMPRLSLWIVSAVELTPCSSEVL